MAARTKQACIVRALESLGASPNERTTSRRYRVFDLPSNIQLSSPDWAPVTIPAGRYWVGSAGAVRKGCVLIAAISLTGGAIAQRLEDYGRLSYAESKENKK
jgi:hypothetical protein